jgi:hypothetical protein
MKLDTGVFNNSCPAREKIGSLTVILYLRALMSFHPYFPQFLTDCGKTSSLHIILLRCYELRVTGKISQSVTITAKQGISRVVVVTEDTIVGLSLIAKLIVSVTYSSRERYLPKPKSAAYSTQSFFTTASLVFPIL